MRSAVLQVIESLDNDNNGYSIWPKLSLQVVIFIFGPGILENGVLSTLWQQFGESPLLFQQADAPVHTGRSQDCRDNQVMQQRGHCNYIISILNQDTPIDWDSFLFNAVDCLIIFCNSPT